MCSLRKFSWYMIFLLVIFIFAQTPLVHAGEVQNVESLFYQANSFYEQGKYLEAVETYKEILQNGYTSGTVLYNLANSYYRIGDKGRALVNYLRASKLIPRDPDLKSNMELLVKDLQIDQVIGFWERVSEYLTLNELIMLTTVISAVVVLLVMLLLYLPRYSYLFKIPSVLSAVGLIILLSGLGIGLYHNYASNPAIVVIEEAVVRFEPNETGEVHYLTKLGNRLEIESVRQDWVAVHRQDGKKGWISREDIVSVNLDNALNGL